MIRQAVEADIPAMLGMAKRFIEKAWARVGVPYDEASCRNTLSALMNQENGVLLIADDRSGMIGVIVNPWHFNSNVLTATELFWWTEPGCRAGRALWLEAEIMAKALGAETMNMACEHHMRSGALERLYARRGYHPSEHIFIKDLR